MTDLLDKQRKRLLERKNETQLDIGNVVFDALLEYPASVNSERRFEVAQPMSYGEASCESLPHLYGVHK